MRKVTRTIGVAFVLGLSVLATSVVYAQGKGHAKKEEQETTEQQKGKSEEARERRHKPSSIKDVVESKREEAKAKGAQKDHKNAATEHRKPEKENNGNAYGKNKGELSGREFGQARAAQAQLTAEERKENLGKAVEDGDKKVKESKEKIARAKEALEKDKKDKKLTDAGYNEKKARIERAEKAVQVLEEKVNAAKTIVTVE
ncbi:hypothetical protein [Pontibacter fetidus]|uniref:DUF4398 domain-containing protein n=1 Tax=Pontibacter fetidus TaxID=2700082 RepID=A0A6B2H8D5_9BACT|nr:hypothetical protein [Pontibacter fetidus]NDK56837.1 hypothetical protein [Pontibacter fetidus]